MVQPISHAAKTETTAPSPAATRASSWRDVYRVHPCADVFPMMSDDEINKLADDIKAHGLNDPVVVLYDSSVGDPDKEYLLDGRNRLTALERLGVDLSPDGKRPFRIIPGCVDEYGEQHVFKFVDLENPAAFVISANIRRRHLTKEQQAELIVKTIKAAKIDIATSAKSIRHFSPTAGKKGGSTKDPIRTAAIAEAAKQDIKPRTVDAAIAKDKRAATTATTVPKPKTPARPHPTIAEYERLLRENKRLRAERDTLQQMLTTAYGALQTLAQGRDTVEAKKLYKRLVLMLHPDRHPEHANIMQEVNALWQAFDTSSRPPKRA